MNASKIWINLSFLIVIVGIGISGGFASTANYVSESNQTSRVQQSTTISTSCLRVNHLSKPISVYRNRFCNIESGDSQLAQATPKPIIF